MPLTRGRPGTPAAVSELPYLIDWDALEAAQWTYLLSAVEPWSKEYPSVEVTYFLEPHGASQALLRHVADSQLVVVGSRGRNILTGALLGSTSLNLLHHCPVPVMLCHTPPQVCSLSFMDEEN
jgi:nucleotide-binding universal stress UspA family protein